MDEWCSDDETFKQENENLEWKKIGWGMVVWYDHIWGITYTLEPIFIRVKETN